ncbi:kinase-like domain-containing protein [Rhizophagus irregularis DAOM 181602=DAOM 197198]|nr:kinase-like domain-containing protein [Rhizophagus irregularis DAOM 181602=DAOM 197198]
MSTTFSIPSNFATCPNCEKTCTSILWCVNCDIAYLVENFKNWSSGDPKLDDFIRHTQKTAKETMDFLEWIDFSQFDLIKYTGKEGSFSTIYTALWMEGPFWNWDEAASIWSRGGPTKVILKRLNDSRELSDQFINQLYDYSKCLNNNTLADCFGVTRDNTSNIMFVFRYYNKGNIYSFLDSCNELLCWRDTVDLLWSIASGIHKIHEQGLMHGHLHGGNILVESERDIMDARVSDTGLHGPPFNTNSEGIYGVVPFVDPEIFKGSEPTQASDIYSFGMIMWTISAGERPYHDRPHDRSLINDIVAGLRPKPAEGTPTLYIQLMEKCLNADPLKRPSALDLYILFEKWVVAICDDPEPSEISDQFDRAEIAKFSDFKNYGLIPLSHKGAIYHSRNLNLI